MGFETVGESCGETQLLRYNTGVTEGICLTGEAGMHAWRTWGHRPSSLAAWWIPVMTGSVKLHIDTGQITQDILEGCASLRY